MIKTALLAIATLSSNDPIRLKIDPLLVAEVVETYGVIASEDPGGGWENPVWPGWNAWETPILLYLPGVQDALINHPRPPRGFQPVATDLLPPGWSLHLRNGKTRFDLDGQNTSTGINGIETLVVADPISNLRPGIVQIVRSGRDAHDAESALTAGLFMTDPYDQLSFVVHEAFHVHQFREARDKRAEEAWLLDYPWLTAENLAGFAMEGRALERALRTEDPAEVLDAAIEFLAIRHDRRRSLPPTAIAYEDGTEFSEGLAKYTEWALFHALEGTTPGEAMRWARSFRGYDDLSSQRSSLLEQMRFQMDGEAVVNGDKYGAGGLRFRLYSSGMAIAALLDALGSTDWHRRILQPGTTLTSLVEDTLAPGDDELDNALDLVQETDFYEALLSRKQVFEERGWEDAESRAEAILKGKGLFTLDYSAVGDTRVDWTYTPFGVSRLRDGRIIYRVNPLSAKIGHHADIDQEIASPAIHDPVRGTIQFRLRGPVDPSSVTTGDVDGILLHLPGATIRIGQGNVRVEEGNVQVTLE